MRLSIPIWSFTKNVPLLLPTVVTCVQISNFLLPWRKDIANLPASGQRQQSVLWIPYNDVKINWSQGKTQCRCGPFPFLNTSSVIIISIFYLPHLKWWKNNDNIKSQQGDLQESTWLIAEITSVVTIKYCKCLVVSAQHDQFTIFSLKMQKN